MSYINVGARVNGARPASKKALREALKDNPGSVTFDGTSPFGEQFSGTVRSIPADATLSVVGPDPYTSRKWYASVTRDAAGKITVK
jgi:hypothetical protein